METLLLDVRYASRMLVKNPGFTTLAVVALALGLGANTAIFSVVNSILLKPLPYADPQRLVVALHNGNFPVSPADFFDYQRDVHAFEQMAAAQAWGGNLMGREGPERIPGLQVGSNMMELLGVAPKLGRSFTSDDGRPGAPHVLLLSHALWMRRFGGDTKVLGQNLTINGASYTVVGVMPESFRFAPFWQTEAEMWTPIDLSARVNDRRGRSLRVFARLKRGVSIAQAQSQMDAVARRLADDFPQSNAKLGITVVPLHEKVVGAVRPTLLVLLGTVGFVLLIACANVANLMLTRAIARRKEIALRIAIGASRLRLIRQLLTESLLLAIVGGLAGLVLARSGFDLLVRILPVASMPRQQELGLDPTAFLFALAMTIATGLLSGLAPSLQLSRSDINEILKEGGRGGTDSAGRRHTRGLLVTAEVALALVLLSGAGLMMRTMLHLQSVDAGFDPKKLLTMEVSIAGTPYDNPGGRAAAFDKVEQALAVLPGVDSVSAINHLPLGGDIWSLDYKIEGRADPAPGEGLGAVYRVVKPAYFSTMRLKLLRGRDFTERDREESPPVAVINDAMARRRWPGEDPIGKRISFALAHDTPGVFQTVVGVVKDARQSDWTSPPDDEIYLPYLQRPNAFGLSYLTFVIRTRTNPETLIGSVRRQISTVDKGLPVSQLRTMEQVIADKLWRSRLATLLLGLFAAIALVLAAVGIYGVISYSVRRRTQEIGIRMALGAKQRDVVFLTLIEGMRPVLAGAAIGVAIALATTRLMKTLLYQVTTTDPATFGLVTAVLMVVAGLANYIPARRAAGVDPLVALRHE
jgi:predicted permease